MNFRDQLNVLRAKADKAMSAFEDSTNKIGAMHHVAVVDSKVTHDNVRVREAHQVPFSVELDQDKFQIVVVLTGEWRMVHGKASRVLHATDIVKVPAGSPHHTLMQTDELGAKFVYVQFK